MIFKVSLRLFEVAAGAMVAVLLGAALWYVLKGVAFIGAGLLKLI